MTTPTHQCAHSCKALCTALERATEEEKKAILQYAAFRDECTYPDVKVMLNELILLRQKSIKLLEETKLKLRGKFDVLDQIREGFNM
jgi:hypothetical protein